MLIFDIETDGLDPSVIWCLGILDFDSDQYSAYVGEEEVAEGLLRLSEADAICGHYVKGFDIPVIERLTDGLIRIDRSKVIDTWEVSRDLFPELSNHKLRTWGEILGLPKLECEDFETYTAAMLPYLERDVRLNAALLRFLVAYLQPDF